MEAGLLTRRAYDAKPATSSVEAVAPDVLKSKPVTLALRYWNGLRGARPYPSREEIAPRDMTSFLRNLVLVRVIDGGQDYEYRICGDAFVQAFGMHFQGMKLSQIEAVEPDYGKATRAVYECVRNMGELFALRGTVAPTAEARFSYHETIFFPFGTDGVVDHLLVVSTFTPRNNDVVETPLHVLLPPSCKGFGTHAAKKPA